jgi:hypothetical protein
MCVSLCEGMENENTGYVQVAQISRRHVLDGKVSLA